MTTHHIIDTAVSELPARARVTIYESDGTTHPTVVDEGLRTEVSPAVDSDDQGRVVAFIRNPRGKRYVLRWDGGGQTTVTAKTL